MNDTSKRFIEQLEKLCNEAGKADKNLFDLIEDFAVMHEELYFQAGILIGLHLHEAAGPKDQTPSDSNALLILFKRLTPYFQRDCSQEIISGKLFEARLDTAFEERLRKDNQYQQTCREIGNKIKRIEQMEWNKKQWLAVDDALSTYNKKVYEYGRTAYYQGLIDAIHYLTKLV